MYISKYKVNDQTSLEQFLEETQLDYWFISEIPNCASELILSTPEKDSELSALLLEHFDMVPYHIETQEEKDWIKAWVDSLKPFNFMDNIWINPYKDRKLKPEDLVDSPSELTLLSTDTLLKSIIEIQIEPGTVFGSGEHATTKLAAASFLKYCSHNDSFLDIGAGSGILSILAAKKGFTKITAIEHEEKALQFAANNFILNNVTVALFQSDLLSAIISENSVNHPYDVIISNIISREQKRLLEQNILSTFMHSNSYLILSGSQPENNDEIEELIKSNEFKIIDKKRSDNWLCWILQKN